ncbi:MAG: LPS-assembly protein LptD [Paracoccaceae bacterium]
MKLFVNFLRLYVIKSFSGTSMISAQETQTSSVIVSDTLSIDADGNMIATGNVQVFRNNQRLEAPKIIYRKDEDRLILAQGGTLRDENGTRFISEAAELDRDLRNGLVRGAKLIGEQQMQVQAELLKRNDGQNTELEIIRATAYASCENPVPIWEIRARSGEIDKDRQQIHFKNAHLRIFGFPVFYTPYLRIPEPGVKRMQGFLFPRTRQNSLLGFGLEFPYFVPIGTDKDVTLIPYVSTETKTLKAKYRQALNNGRLTVNTAVSKDSIQPEKFRGRLQSDGAFKLPNDYDLDYNFELVSDDAYLTDYEFGASNRIQNDVSIAKTDKHAHQEAQLIYYHSLFDAEDTRPTIINYNQVDRHFRIPSLSGIWNASLILHNNFRASDLDELGRDIRRLNTALSWSEEIVLPGGVLLDALAQTRWSSFLTRQDLRYPNEVTSLGGDLALNMRWPLMRSSSAASFDLIEPIAQIAYTHENDLTLPLEESTHSEFDEGNLISLSRYPAFDRHEKNLRWAVGGRWKHHSQNGTELSFSFGRIFRKTPEDDFNSGSGLRRKSSDLLVSAGFDTQNGITILARALLDEDNAPNRAEALFDYAKDNISFSTGFSYLPESIDEEREESISELRLAAGYKVGQNWTFSGDTRYDITDGRAARAGIGISFDNECTTVHFSAAREFSKAGSASSLTSWNLIASLKGFGTGGNRTPIVKNCGE